MTSTFTRVVQALVRLEPIATERYVRDVLPATFDRWGDGRTFETYANDFRTVARSYGKRRPFTLGIAEGGRIVCSCKNYEREFRAGTLALRATGIGAVFTPEAERGRGLATLMIGALLDAERAAGRDLAYLYSDIAPAFYERLGFLECPSRLVSIRATSFDGAPARAKVLERTDWTGVRRCFEALDDARPWGFRRTPAVWDWMRARWDAPPAGGAQTVQLVVRDRRNVVAYAIGRRVLREDAFVVDDFGYEGGAGRERIGPLLRAAAGDLRRVTGWLPPSPARDALPGGSVRKRKTAIFMIAPLSAAARAWWENNKDAIVRARGDATWSADHV